MFMYPSPKVQPTTCSFFKVTKGLNPQMESILILVLHKMFARQQ